MNSLECAQNTFFLKKPAQLHDKANPDWKLHASMGYATDKLTKGFPDKARHQRLVDRRRKKMD